MKISPNWLKPDWLYAQRPKAAKSQETSEIVSIENSRENYATQKVANVLKRWGILTDNSGATTSDVIHDGSVLYTTWFKDEPAENLFVDFLRSISPRTWIADLKNYPNLSVKKYQSEIIQMEIWNIVWWPLRFLEARLRNIPESFRSFSG